MSWEYRIIARTETIRDQESHLVDSRLSVKVWNAHSSNVLSGLPVPESPVVTRTRPHMRINSECLSTER